jgi:hypothetical protein
MIFTRDDLRPVPSYPTYPPYHVGDYIEDYFYKWFQKNCTKDVKRDYIAISWTTLYCENKDPGIQNFLNSLDPNKSYFTVCQHDDGPIERLPMNTLIFSAGGNQTNGNIIPIPLICSKLSDTFINESKTILCSFVGSVTHPIRKQLIDAWKDHPQFIFAAQNWTPNVPEKNLTIFKTLTAKSKFTLCPRGYGKTSFRLYEAMQLGSVPVYVSDSHYLPWTDEINWSEFCVLIKPDQISELNNILSSYTEDKIHKMIKTAQQLYNTHFSMNGMCLQIATKLYRG